MTYRRHDLVIQTVQPADSLMSQDTKRKVNDEDQCHQGVKVVGQKRRLQTADRSVQDNYEESVSHEIFTNVSVAHTTKRNQDRGRYKVHSRDTIDELGACQDHGCTSKDIVDQVKYDEDNVSDLLCCALAIKQGRSVLDAVSYLSVSHAYDL